MAGTHASEGQAVWQPGGAEEDSRLREGNRHLHLAYDEEEEGSNPAFSMGRFQRQVIPMKKLHSSDYPLPCHTTVSARTDWPSVGTLWLGEIAILIYSFYLSVAAHTFV